MQPYVDTLSGSGTLARPAAPNTIERAAPLTPQHTSAELVHQACRRPDSLRSPAQILRASTVAELVQHVTQLHRQTSGSEFRELVSSLLVEKGGHAAYACGTFDESLASLLLAAARRLRAPLGLLDAAEAMLSHVSQMGGLEHGVQD